MSIPYKEAYLLCAVIVACLHKVLDVRQLYAIKRPTAPVELHGVFKEGLYAKTQSYCLHKWWFNFAQSLWNLAETLALVWVDALPWAWALAGRSITRIPAPVTTWLGLADSTASFGAVERAQSVAFALLLAGWSLLTGLPWSAYSTFVIEARHGFNKQSPALFLSDLAKSLLLGLLLMPPLVYGMAAILAVASPWMPMYLWLFILAFSLLILTLYPTIQAWFNKFEPLPQGPLRDAIEALANRLRFPLKKLYVMDGSRHSSHSNAYMFGFYRNKRIVLYDTLLAQCSQDEVLAVLAHELGHWKLRHTALNLLMGQAIMLSQFLLFAAVRNSPQLGASFGFAPTPAFISFILFQLISAPLDEVVNFVMHVVSRMFEFQADRFAVQLGHGKSLRSALLVMHEENKSSFHVDAWYQAFHFSHPHVVERLKAIDKEIIAGGKDKAE